MTVADIKVRAHGRHVECHLARHVRTVDEHHHAVLVTQGRELKCHGLSAPFAMNMQNENRQQQTSVPHEQAE